jgi:hypothetical protein
VPCKKNRTGVRIPTGSRKRLIVDGTETEAMAEARRAGRSPAQEGVGKTAQPAPGAPLEADCAPETGSGAKARISASLCPHRRVRRQHLEGTAIRGICAECGERVGRRYSDEEWGLLG